MKGDGFSLLEMVVIICIISILLAIGTLRFKEYADTYKTEAETRSIYSALLKARADAVYQRRATRVKLYTSYFEVYSSTGDSSGGIAPVETYQLPFPISCNAGGDGSRGYNLEFDSRGVARDSCSICVDNHGAGGVDSIVMSQFALKIGKKDKGDACKSDNITVR